MSMRKLVIVITASLLAIAALWIFIPAGIPKTDAARYGRWKHTGRLFGRVIWWERRLPNCFDQLFRLPARERQYVDEHERLGETLIASGYVTNFPVEMAIAPTNYERRAQLADRLRRVFQGRNEWEFGVASNAVIFTCRPRDVALCRQAVQQ